MEVVVEFDYDALHDDELTLRLGDVIKNVRYNGEDGWMEGDLNGKRGLFPDNFVKEVKKDSKEAKEAKSEPKDEGAAPQRRDKTSGTVANLVQRMSTIGIPTGGFHPHPPAASKKPKKRQCKAQFDYQPVNEDELELKVGDVIDITEEVEEGWWSGSLNGKTGLFPSNFVKELDAMADDGEPSEAPAEESDGSLADGSATPTSPPPHASGNGAIAQPKKIRGIGFGDIFKEGSVKLKARLPSPETEDKKDKDTGDPGWWRGESGGEEGVFPDNFVTPVPEPEKEAPASRGSVKASPRPDTEEKPRKPPPPSKSTALKPEVPSADRKPHFKAEDRDKPTPEPKPSKPAAPVVPPKKPLPPPGKGRPGGVPPKRPDKPHAPSPSLKHNGEVPSIRPKSEYEPLVPTKMKTLSGDWGDKSSDAGDLMSFDDVSSASEKLSHPTADRPKMPGRRLPAQFGGGHSPNKELNLEKSFKAEEEEGKAKQAEPRKPTTSALSPSPSLHKHDAKPTPEPSGGGLHVGGGHHGSLHGGHHGGGGLHGGHHGGGGGHHGGGRAHLESEEAEAPLDELRNQLKDLLMSVELLKAQQTKEMSDLRRALDEEIQKRVALQLEIESLKRSVHST